MASLALVTLAAVAVGIALRAPHEVVHRVMRLFPRLLLAVIGAACLAFATGGVVAMKSHAVTNACAWYPLLVLFACVGIYMLVAAFLLPDHRILKTLRHFFDGM